MGVENQVSAAAAFAQAVHSGQVDKAGADYFGHVCRVADLVASVPGFAELDIHEKHVAVAAAYLHDVIEDCEVSALDLAHVGFSDEVIHVVELVSKNVEPCSLNEYHKKIADDKIARIVKIADIADNSNKVRQAVLVEKGIYFNFNKYVEAVKVFNFSQAEADWFAAAI